MPVLLASSMTREKKSHRAENVLRAEDPQLGEDVLHALHHDLHPRRVPDVGPFITGKSCMEYRLERLALSA